MTDDDDFNVTIDKAIFKVGLLSFECDALRSQLAKAQQRIAELSHRLAARDAAPAGEEGDDDRPVAVAPDGPVGAGSD